MLDVRCSFFEPGLTPFAIDCRPVGAFCSVLDVGRLPAEALAEAGSAFDVRFLNQGLRPLLLTAAPSGLLLDVGRLPAEALAEAGSAFDVHLLNQ